jgi:hypothetical protein
MCVCTDDELAADLVALLNHDDPLPIHTYTDATDRILDKKE